MLRCRRRHGERRVEVLIGEHAIALALAQIAAHHPGIEILFVGLQRLVGTALGVGQLSLLQLRGDQQQPVRGHLWCQLDGCPRLRDGCGIILRGQRPIGLLGLQQRTLVFQRHAPRAQRLDIRRAQP